MTEKFWYSERQWRIVPHISLKTICRKLRTHIDSKCNRNFYSNNQDCRILVLTYTKQRVYTWVKIWWSASSNRRALHELSELQPWHPRMLRLHFRIKKHYERFCSLTILAQYSKPWLLLANLPLFTCDSTHFRISTSTEIAVFAFVWQSYTEYNLKWVLPSYTEYNWWWYD